MQSGAPHKPLTKNFKRTFSEPPSAGSQVQRNEGSCLKVHSAIPVNSIAAHAGQLSISPLMLRVCPSSYKQVRPHRGGSVRPQKGAPLPSLDYRRCGPGPLSTTKNLWLFTIHLKRICRSDFWSLWSYQWWCSFGWSPLYHPPRRPRLSQYRPKR